MEPIITCDHQNDLYMLAESIKNKGYNLLKIHQSYDNQIYIQTTEFTDIINLDSQSIDDYCNSLEAKNLPEIQHIIDTMIIAYAKLAIEPGTYDIDSMSPSDREYAEETIHIAIKAISDGHINKDFKTAIPEYLAEYRGMTLEQLSHHHPQKAHAYTELANTLLTMENESLMTLFSANLQVYTHEFSTFPTHQSYVKGQS